MASTIDDLVRTVGQKIDAAQTLLTGTSDDLTAIQHEAKKQEFALVEAEKQNAALQEQLHQFWPPFQLWDSTAPGFLVAQGLPRLKCPSEGHFQFNEDGSPDLDWIRANTVPQLAGFPVLSLDVERYTKRDSPNDEAPTTAVEVGYLCDIVQCFKDANGAQRVGVYMTPVERYGGCATVGPGPMRDQRMKDWTARNRIQIPLADKVDFIFPSLYGVYDMPIWVTFALQNINQARGVAFGRKPVIAYLWPEWHRNSGQSGLIPYDKWTTMLETCRVCDGIAIWQGSDRRFDPMAPWWKATEDFMRKYSLNGR